MTASPESKTSSTRASRADPGGAVARARRHPHGSHGAGTVLNSRFTHPSTRWGVCAGKGGIAPVPAANDFLGPGRPSGCPAALTLGLEFSISEFASSLRRHLPSRGSTPSPTTRARSRAGCSGSTASIPAPAGVTISPVRRHRPPLNDLGRLGNRKPQRCSDTRARGLAPAATPLLAVPAGGSFLNALLGVGIAVTAWAAARHHPPFTHRSTVAHPGREQLMLGIWAHLDRRPPSSCTRRRPSCVPRRPDPHR
jgi:hypothetical protein